MSMTKLSTTSVDLPISMPLDKGPLGHNAIDLPNWTNQQCAGNEASS